MRTSCTFDVPVNVVVVARTRNAGPPPPPHVDAGGISLTEDGTITSRSPSDDTVAELDQLQSRLHEGPCITAIDEPPSDGMVLADDLAGGDAPRWPRFAPEAAQAGYRSILSTALTTGGGTRAALNLYSRDARAQQHAERAAWGARTDTT